MKKIFKLIKLRVAHYVLIDFFLSIFTIVCILLYNALKSLKEYLSSYDNIKIVLYILIISICVHELYIVLKWAYKTITNNNN
jgi:uncharacterized membrane protein YedE/YeeE